MSGHSERMYRRFKYVCKSCGAATWADREQVSGAGERTDIPESLPPDGSAFVEEAVMSGWWRAQQCGSRTR
jgi:hypothetical protein